MIRLVQVSSRLHSKTAIYIQCNIYKLKRAVLRTTDFEDEVVCKVSLAYAYIILLIRPMAASNDDVAAPAPATCAELANDSSPVPTTTFVSPRAGPLLPGVPTLAGFFVCCMTDISRDIVGPTYPMYGTVDYGPMFDKVKMTQYSQIVDEHSPRHQDAHALEVMLAECMNRGIRVSEEHRQALHVIVKEFLHLQWLSDAIPTSLNLARTAFAAISDVDRPGVQTAIFLGLHDQAISAFKNILEDSRVTMHLAASLRDDLQDIYYPDNSPDPITMIDR